MTVRVIFKYFRDFYGQNYAYPTVTSKIPGISTEHIETKYNLYSEPHFQSLCFTKILTIQETKADKKFIAETCFFFENR